VQGQYEIVEPSRDRRGLADRNRSGRATEAWGMTTFQRTLWVNRVTVHPGTGPGLDERAGRKAVTTLASRPDPDLSTPGGDAARQARRYLAAALRRRRDWT